jgi:ABC-type polysaccharide/polyol phosphate transport system ATPase subunit
MRELCEQARTIVIVSHALNTISELTDEVIWIHQGKVKIRDEPEVAIEAYQRFLGVEQTDEAALEDP